MAFVLDQHDPAALGMFSKSGRFTSEKYIIFQKKDEILNNQRKFLKVTALPHLKVDYDAKENNRFVAEEQDTKPKTTTASKTVPKFEPFSQQMSREEFYEVKKVKNPPPPGGFYNPKFEHVEKTPQTLFKYEKEKTKAKFFSTMTDFSEEEASRPLPDKLQKKVMGPTLFHLQTAKGSLLSPSNHPHDDRFTYLTIPENCSKSRRPLKVDMRKTLPRDTKFLFKDLEFSPDYDVNFEVARKRLGSCGAPFERNSPRKPMHYVSSCTNENFYDASKKESLNYSRSPEARFENYSCRDWDSASPLPSFMQKTMNGRFAIGTLRQKTLEINGFSEGKFQTVHTSFSPVKRKLKKAL